MRRRRRGHWWVHARGFFWVTGLRKWVPDARIAEERQGHLAWNGKRCDTLRQAERAIRRLPTDATGLILLQYVGVRKGRRVIRDYVVTR